MAEESRPAWEGWWSQSVPPGPPRVRRFTARWSVLGTVFLLPILVPAVRAVLADGSPATITRLALVATYGACYLVYPLVLFKQRDLRVQLAFCAGMLLLGWLTLFDGGSVYVLIFAMAVIAFGLPPGWTLVFDGTSLAAAVVVQLMGGFHGTLGDVGTVAGVTAAMFSVGRLLYTVRHLRAAQDEIATLAVTAERERVARDLHDILGHSLTTITVKAGLARRVLETAKDTDRAITEIHEVEGLARSALSDVRATVSEYREVSLSAELVGARAALRAAEIDADLPHAVDNVRPDLQQTFGYVLREAVTNVIRHSGAKQVKVRLGRTWMEIEDDGIGGLGTAGNGLRGLGERLAQIGGTLCAEPRPGGGFLVKAVAA